MKETQEITAESEKREIKKEEIFACIRPHWIYLTPSIAVFLISIFFIMALNVMSETLVNNSVITGNEFVILNVVLFVIGVAASSRGILQWHNTHYIITNQKVTMVRLGNWVSYEAREALFSLIKSITHKKNGFLANLLNYGHIKLNIDEIAAQSLMNMRYIKDSDEVTKILDKLVLKHSEA